jgi:hypothetical protein
LQDTGWAKLGSKLEGCVAELKEWRKKSKNNVQKGISKLYRRLLELQSRKDISDLSKIKKKLKTELHILLDNEELRW